MCVPSAPLELDGHVCGGTPNQAPGSSLPGSQTAEGQMCICHSPLGMVLLLSRDSWVYNCS